MLQHSAASQRSDILVDVPFSSNDEEISSSALGTQLHPESKTPNQKQTTIRRQTIQLQSLRTCENRAKKFLWNKRNESVLLPALQRRLHSTLPLLRGLAG